MKILSRIKREALLMKPSADDKIKTHAKPQDKGNYQTLKSTFIMGGASVINIILGIIRNKVIALLLNPSGMGLAGVYQSISNLAATISGMGINESGARQVSLAFEAGNQSLISRTSLSLRRIAFITGIGGMVLLLLLSQRVGFLTFHNTEHTLDIALLSLTILFGTISGGQFALIQGARKITYLAYLNVLGPLWGTLLSLPIIYFMGVRGVVSYLIIMSATNIMTSWWYSKKIKIPSAKASWHNSILDAKPLVRLGTALMIGTIIGVGTSYLLRILLIRRLGLDAAGEFQASSILSTVYVGILFKAMATDFYPRLSAASMSDMESGLLVNEQIEAGLLLAVPGVLVTLTFAPPVMVILYSSKFLPAVDVLRWQVLGVLLQVVTWPMGYILRAKAAGGLFIGTELFSSSIYLAATWIGIGYIGLPGIGIAYFVYNVLYFILIYRVVHTKYGFSFVPKNVQLLMLAVTTTAAALLSTYFIPRYYIPLNIVITIAAGVYSYRKLALSQWVARFINIIKQKH
jgi:PST family polysaccharide transporter